MVDLKSKTAKYIGQFIILLLGFFLDGSLKSTFTNLNKPSFQVSLQILLLLLVIMVLHDQKEDNHLFWYSLILGVLYDSYYSRIFGLYSTILPLTVIVVQTVQSYIPESFVFEWSMYFIVLTISMLYLYIIGVFLNLALVDMTRFITDWLGPTLLVNSIIFLVLYFPMTKLINWLWQ
ncbi:rod shape-determining protein MreD [Bombilactobacillus bombi]|uniref:rod shape-determining protein MreD n=1 Tax=Bombilactobacillus bombi TaxID=1303590 RepID=UPI0015E5CBCC|nr:rod shape-determining protein MreD [Bombilactobacillus bombi]